MGGFRFSPNKGKQMEVDTRSERILRAREVIGRLGISRSGFYNLIRDGEFPRAVKVTRQRVGWLEHEVNDFLRSRPRVERTDRGA